MNKCCRKYVVGIVTCGLALPFIVPGPLNAAIWVWYFIWWAIYLIISKLMD